MFRCHICITLTEIKRIFTLILDTSFLLFPHKEMSLKKKGLAGTFVIELQNFAFLSPVNFKVKKTQQKCEEF